MNDFGVVNIGDLDAQIFQWLSFEIKDQMVKVKFLSKLHSPPLKDAWITLPSPLMFKYTLSSLEKKNVYSPPL